KFLWLKINPLPPGYTGSVYRAQFEIYSASGRILVTLDVHRQQWVCSANNPRREPRQPGGCKLKTAPVRPVVAARPAEYVCSEDLFY
ncbi:hypothetical protein OFM97_23855, partial [Escherichia coli]|nr:hypothetical protein [Escherichia coli]